TNLDGTRGYQPGSETDGVHDGSPYTIVNPMWYYEDTASDRGSRINGFNPEYGTPILPTIDALREMMDEKDLWPIDKKTWWYLDGDGFHGMTGFYNEAVREYGAPSSIEEYAWKAQMVGALAHQTLWEAWNAQRFEYGDRFSSGFLFWYLNSANRQTCGRMWDWSLEPTAGLFSTQKANEPLHVQYDFLKNTVGVNNELRRPFPGLTVTARILNFDLKEVYRGSAKLNVPADAFVKDVLKVKLPANLSPVHFIKLTLTDASGALLSENFYWRSNQEYKPGRTNTGPLLKGMSSISRLPKADATSAVRQYSEDGKNFYEVKVTNSTDVLAFMVWLRLQDVKTGKPIRPAFYSDNFFSLLPGESRVVKIEYSGSIAPASTQLLVDGWNIVRRLYVGDKVTVLPDIRTIRSKSLAEGKPVAASSSEGEWKPENVTDLDDNSRWASQRNDDQWIAIDLGGPTRMSEVRLAWESAHAKEFKLQVSDDAKSWRDIAHVTDSKGGVETVKFPLTTARYIRLLGVKRASGYGYSLYDFAVYP
ncbi:MAG TPA: discoidin domain-containing protein, partial [Chthoniobacterales bacterium]|nr:discoidin domain-containing protein [Chthoniobacterales bacterium]